MKEDAFLEPLVAAHISGRVDAAAQVRAQVVVLREQKQKITAKKYPRRYGRKGREGKRGGGMGKEGKGRDPNGGEGGQQTPSFVRHVRRNNRSITTSHRYRYQS